MRLLSLIILLFSFGASLAETSPQATPSVNQIRILTADRKLEEANRVANLALRATKEDHIVLGCLTWAINKILITEATSSTRYTRERISEHFSDSCDIGNESKSVLESDELAETLTDQSKTRDGREKLNAIPQNIRPYMRGLLKGAHEECREFIGPEMPMCKRMADVIILIETLPLKEDE
jgi:hypothetical protein